MLLQRSPHSSCEPQVWGLDFLMETRDGTPMRCNVTRRALDKLHCDDGTLPQCEQRAIFEGARALIEIIASQKYDDGRVEDGWIVVRSEDIEKAKLASV